MKTTYTTIAFILASSTSVSEAGNSPSLEQCFPDDIPWYTYRGKDYIFTRMKYNSVCVDSTGEQYENGKIEGVYPPIDDPNGGCGKLCIEGYGRGQARGCTSMKPNHLVGFNYNCDENACYCLYESGTWNGDSTPCFDSIDTDYDGEGDVAGTEVQRGSTCYYLQVQPAPAPAPGSSICVRSLDYDCYKTGRPACCDDDEYTCPDYMTMCDNTGEDETGTSYCTNAPDNDCYSDGWPSCCSAPGGDIMNCPIDQPDCETNEEATAGAVAAKLVKYLRATHKQI